MKLLLCLTRFRGAEMINHNGEYGVFIPLAPNGVVRQISKGKPMDMFVSLFSWKNKSPRRKCNEMFFCPPPPDARDMLLDGSEPISSRRTVAWSFRSSKNEPTNKLSSKEFEDLLGI